ncbi:DUF3325 family protein [Acinetobacter ihumii]|uniref:DUF3325 family protein n=1 Tax=Acinetobacter ihumii TaxID=2483802 RepID=UPI0010305B0D|nr:DUF3325 family protein [Acinetobacter ihumii]
MIFLMLYVLCLWGFIALASYYEKHQSQIYQKNLSDRTAKFAVFIGYILLIIALLLAIIVLRPSIGISYWFGILTLAGLTVGWTLTYHAPRFFKVMAALSLGSMFTILMLALA